MYKVDKGVPMPNKDLSPLMEALRGLSVGDSILITDLNAVQVAQRVRRAGKYGQKYSWRKMPDGYRVWRME